MVAGVAACQIKKLVEPPKLADATCSVTPPTSPLEILEPLLQDHFVRKFLVAIVVGKKPKLVECL